MIEAKKDVFNIMDMTEQNSKIIDHTGVILAGASTYIGRELCHVLRNAGFTVFGIGRFSSFEYYMMISYESDKAGNMVPTFREHMLIPISLSRGSNPKMIQNILKVSEAAGFPVKVLINCTDVFDSRHDRLTMMDIDARIEDERNITEMLAHEFLGYWVNDSREDNNTDKIKTRIDDESKTKRGCLYLDDYQIYRSYHDRENDTKSNCNAKIPTIINIAVTAGSTPKKNADYLKEQYLGIVKSNLASFGKSLFAKSMKGNVYISTVLSDFNKSNVRQEKVAETVMYLLNRPEGVMIPEFWIAD